jgi:hypothetical protein
MRIFLLALIAERLSYRASTLPVVGRRLVAASTLATMGRMFRMM